MGKSVVSELASTVVLPDMYEIHQNLEEVFLDENAIREVIHHELSCDKIKNLLYPKMSVAVTCGSRGVANIAVIIQEVVARLKEYGVNPFVVPAMGSHGGATAEGQRKILESYHVVEEFIGCPVKSSMEVKQIGCVNHKTPVYIDRMAAEADGIVVIGRIKPHTGFRGKYESGLMKMMVIGLGKQKGAEICHLDGFGKMAENIESYGKVILKEAPVLFGLGIIENAKEQTFRVAALTPQEIIDKEPEYLQEAKGKMPKIPFTDIDVLIVDQIGKDISGDGMDPNITGTFCSPYAKGGIHAEHVVILDLTEASHGCAIGMGMADFTTRRFYNKIDFEASYPNAITSKMVVQAKIPMVLANDREAIQVALRTCCGIEKRAPRIVRIKDTLHLEKFWISETMVEEAESKGNLKLIKKAMPFGFDGEGNLF